MFLLFNFSLIATIDAHGRLLWPLPRLLPGDDGNGYTYARTASHDACQNLPTGSPKTPPLAGGSTTFEYLITAAHQGGCTIFMDRGKGWETIGTDPTCGSSSHTGSIKVQIPTGNYKAVVRWYYKTENGSGEEFNNCADVTVSTSGSNSHTTGSTGNLQQCVRAGDLMCNGLQQMQGFGQCDGKFWVSKYCPAGTMCVQDVISNPSAGQLGSIHCGPSTVTGASTGGGTGSGSAGTGSTGTTTPATGTGDRVGGACSKNLAWSCGGVRTSLMMQCVNGIWHNMSCQSGLVCNVDASGYPTCNFARKRDFQVLVA
ncbi:hypothetical protein HDU76_013190 [Blyttiomyces sp. JEL0837]|nr:hypothetical protein HDU76_013190 [Blyttiomyces sp. JEL0837]